MNRAAQTQTKRPPFVFVDPYPDTLLIPSQTFDTTPVINRDQIEDAEIVDESTGDGLELNESIMRIIFESIREEIDERPRTDNTYELDWGAYIITAKHHYESHSEDGGDHYCGIWEQVEVVDRDELEIERVYNIIDGFEDKAAMQKLNIYSKKHAL